MSHTPGYHGQYLRVDLTDRTWTTEPIPGDVLRAFIGGTGLGTWIVGRESESRQDPLGPSNPLAFVFSPLVGSPLTTSAKFAVVTHSPLTNRLNDSLSSSHFAIAGKKAGYDAIVLVGRVDTPSVLLIENNGVSWQDASDLWGLPVSQTERRLRAELGAGFRTAVIGPAGERGVLFASISHDRRHAGRGGPGAVLGAKNLKAVAVRGDRLPEVARPDEVIRYSRELSRLSMGPATAKYRELGTVDNLLTFNRLGTLPTHNFREGTFQDAPKLAPDSLSMSGQRMRDSCAACTIGCEHLFEAAGGRSVRMEYENLFALGPLCGVSDPQAVLQASQLCDELGMDTISAGGTTAFAMECAERGLINAPWLRFGDSAALIKALELIGARSGLGEMLSQGSRIAAGRIGQGAEDFAAHVKGLELPGYEPRALQTMALGLAVNTRGADHNRSGAYQVDFSTTADRFHADPSAAAGAIATENEAAVMDSLILCKFLRGIFDDRLEAMAEMLQLVTGWDVTAGELDATAGRIVDARKWFNIRQGWTPHEDRLPKRFLTEELPSASGPGARLNEAQLKEMIAAYNLARGWDAEGWLPEERIRQLQRWA